MSNTYLLTTKSCTKCPVVKQLIEDKGLDIKYIDIEEDPQKAIDNMVMSVPTIVVEKEKNDIYVGQKKCLDFVNSL